MSTALSYSGFLSALVGGPITKDIMSSFVNGSDGQWGVGTATNLTYTYGYIYIGELLVQFTKFNSSQMNIPYTSNNNTQITIKFPIPYNNSPNGPACVLAVPGPNGTTGEYNYTVSVTGCTSSQFTVKTGTNFGNIQYLAIGTIPST
jgi:hypothetical protein